MDINWFHQILTEYEIVLVYFSGYNCNVCKAMFPKIEQLLNQYPKIKLIKLFNEENPEIFGQNQILSIPTVIIYFEGKEFIRKIRNFSIEELAQELNRPYSLFVG